MFGQKSELPPERYNVGIRLDHRLYTEVTDRARDMNVNRSTIFKLALLQYLRGRANE